MWIQWPFFSNTWTKGHWPQDDLWPHVCWGNMCDSTQGSLCPRPTKIHQSMWIQWPFCAKTWTKGHWHLDDLWPMSFEVTCVTLPRIIVSIPTKIHQSMWIQWFFCAKTWTKGHWPLDDLWTYVCWGHMCNSTQGSLCPSPTKIHQSMWIQWPFFKTWTKGYWHLDDLDPMFVEVTCATLPKDYCVQVSWKYIKVCGYSNQFCKITTYYVLHSMYVCST